MSAKTSKSNGIYPSINIIGAGIAGLSLACHLRRRRIPYNIFDAASRPKGHNYGITISPWGYTDLLPTIEPKLNMKTFRELTAVDRLIGGTGIISSSNSTSDDFRASDMALREVLANGHQVKWNHKVISAEPVPEGLMLKFENGEQSTANITIDAGGERPGLMLLLVQTVKPEILPYAVYHGSRYLPQSTLDHDLKDIFREGENVRSFPPPSDPNSSTWHLQLYKSHITPDQLPSKVKAAFASNGSNPVIELRYTFSRPAITTSPDPLFNPTRTPNEATSIPPTLTASLSTHLSNNNNNTIPPSVATLLSASSLTQDRILNWLMRTKPIDRTTLQTLSSTRVIAIGDAIHSTPPVHSEGASAAMVDAAEVTRWIVGLSEDGVETEAVKPENVMQFYDRRAEVWEGLVADARSRLKEMHVPSGTKKNLDGRL